MIHRAPILLALTAAPACTSLPGAQFEGVRAPQLVAADQLRQHEYVPHDHQAIGTVTANCQRSRDPLEHDTCSETDLLRWMREEASQAGGTAFVAPACHYERSGDRRWIRCSATVARRRSSIGKKDRKQVSSAPQQRRWTVNVGGRPVEVTARPRAGLQPVPRSVDGVERSWDAATEADRFGYVEASCGEGCQRSQAMEGLLHGAAWLGAEAITAIRCVQTTARSWRCLGEAVVR